MKYYDQVGLLVVEDSSGNQLRGTALLDFCSSWCDQNPNGLVGIDIGEGPSTSKFYCDFSNPLPTGLTAESYSPTGSLLYDNYAGVGAVRISDRAPDWKCYRVKV